MRDQSSLDHNSIMQDKITAAFKEPTYDSVVTMKTRRINIDGVSIADRDGKVWQCFLAEVKRKDAIGSIRC